MTVDKRISYEIQGGAKNYLGKQKEVTAPIKWKSSPDSPETELAYITKAEKDLLVKKDIHGSLKGSVNRGPSGIMSLDGFGSFDDPSDPGKDTGMSGAATSAAERGGGSGADRRELAVESQRVRGGPALPPGVLDKNAQDLRSAFIAAGGGQRVNPGFFDSRNVVSPAELARARAFNPAAFKAGRRGGIMDFFTGGGFLGNIIRSIGQRFGLGKTYDQPTYDMSRLSGLPLGGSAAFANLDIRDKFNRLGDDKEEEKANNVASGFVAATGTNYPGANKFVAPRKRITYSDTPVIQDYLTDEMFEEQFGGSNLTTPNYLKSFEGLYSLPEKEDFLGNTSEDYQITPNSINAYQAKLATNSPALAQFRSLQKKKRLSELGGPEFTIEDQQKLNTLEQMEADPNTVYSQTV